MRKDEKFLLDTPMNVIKLDLPGVFRPFLLNTSFRF